MVSLLTGLLHTSLQLPLDNRENKNSQNVCLSQIRENIFPRKFLLIQNIIHSGQKNDIPFGSCSLFDSGIVSCLFFIAILYLYVCKAPRNRLPR